MLRAGLAVAALLIASGAQAAKATAPAAPPAVAGPTAPSTTAAPSQPPILTPSIAEPPPGATDAEVRSRDADPAYGAYQRGFYRTALNDAQKRLAADPDNAASLTLLGQLYTEGVAVKRDLSRASDYFRRAAARGDANAAFSLGVNLLEGQGVAVDRVAAQKQFQAAATKNHPGALYNLGVLMVESQAAPDFPKAIAFFKRASDAGSADAAYSLGVLYRQGRGVGRDDSEALTWFRKAADENNVPAMIEFAIMAFNGQGMKADEALAARYFLKAAQRNNPVAQNRAARLLVAGRGIAPDMVEGMKWHLLARSAGVGDAWLDGRLATLTTAQRTAVEDAVRRYTGM